MVERGVDGLTLESRERGGISGKCRGEHLDGHFAIEPRIARAIDRAHGAGAERTDDFVETEPGAGRQHDG
jgi:hypothetical protein